MGEGTTMDRRTFFGLGGVAAAGVALGLSGCAPKASTSSQAEGESVDSENWYGSPAELDSFDFAEEVDTEVLICGGGHGGMLASLAAAEKGAKTLVLEKTGEIGIVREYIGAIGSKVQRESGNKTDPQTVVNELMRYASYRADQRLINLWAQRSGEVVDWLMGHLEKQGLWIVAENDIGDSDHHGCFPVYPTQMNIQSDEQTALGESMAAQYIVKAAQDLGAEYRFNTSLVQLIQDENGTVTGAVAKNGDDQYIKVNASKGVILATGGYEGDSELFTRLNERESAVTAFNTGLPQNMGDGIKAGIWVGGRKDETATAMLFDRGILHPDEKPEAPFMGTIFWMGSQPWLKVNSKGKRFCNEEAPYDFPIFSSGLDKGKSWYPIWDANWKDNIVQFHTIGCSRIDKSPTEGITQNFFFESIEGMNGGLLEGGYIQQADTIEELAEKLGLPADALKATVEEYNQMANDGADTLFGKNAKHMIALTTPPYYGARQGGMLLCTLDGLRINESCQVINSDDEPISGLWACGNVTGGFFADNYPELVVGVACGRTWVEAYTAVENILSA